MIVENAADFVHRGTGDFEPPFPLCRSATG